MHRTILLFLFFPALTTLQLQTSTCKNEAASKGRRFRFDTMPIPSPVAHYQKSGLIMIPVLGGAYQMGSSTTDTSYQNDECQHPVEVANFAIGRYEITQADWREVVGSNPPNLGFKGCDECPVENVSWDDAQEFIKRANSKYRRYFRLPTEQEWEYAARGGNKSKGYIYAGSNDLQAVSWYDDNSYRKTHPVGLKMPNELGLYDMNGNVWEWCQDRWWAYPDCSDPKDRGIDYRVFRGGSWRNGDSDCRLAYRNRIYPLVRLNNVGFRLAQD